MNNSDTLQVILAHHSTVFENYWDWYRRQLLKYMLTQQPNPVPYALCDKADKELDHLVKEGVIQSVTHSKWAAPVVPVVKHDGSVYLCGDYKITVAKFDTVVTHFHVRIDDLFVSLSDESAFTKLDVAYACLQAISTK